MEPLAASQRYTAWRLVGMLYAVALVLGHALAFAYDGTDLNVLAVFAGVMLALAWLAHRRGLPRVGHAMEAAMVMLAASVATAIVTALFASAALPLQDDLLARGDAAFAPGAWRVLHDWTAARPSVLHVLREIYATLALQPFVLVPLLALCGKIERLWRLAAAWGIALAVCAGAFAFAPAIGPYVHYGLANSPLLTAAAPGFHAPEVLTALREGSLRTIGASQLTGLVAFPSFHTAGALLLAWGALALPRWLAAPFVLLNLMMVASTPIVGSHYFVDVLAGIALAWAAAAATRGQYARATANSTASTMASLALPPANGPIASMAR